MEATAKLKRVGVLFSGGPAPGANAVIAAATSALRRDGIEAIGFMNGYSHLIDYGGDPSALKPGVAYRVFEDRDLWGLRHARGICLGTARAHPGREVDHVDQLGDAARTAGLARVCQALRDLHVDALISIGGDGTLRTANLLHAYQQRLPPELPRVRLVHVPKTIDNDYDGIDFTFGFFTAVDVTGKELLNLRADAMATQSYFVVTTMGRKAGWLAYGAAVAGEAHMVLGVEDVDASLRGSDGALDLDAVAERIVKLMTTRERRDKTYGVVVLAEGLTSLLPKHALAGADRDRYGNVSFSTHDLSRVVARKVAERYRALTGNERKVSGVQLGYESRCAEPNAFDVLLGTQLGFGAYRALVEEGLDAHMVSVAGQLELRFIPFARLLDPITLGTRLRYVEPGSDFHRLAQQLGTRIDDD